MKNNILTLLNLKGKSIRQMSKDMGIDYSTAHRIATKDDLSTISLGRLLEVANYLKVDIKELYTRKGEIEMREEIRGLDARYEEIREKLFQVKANGDLSKLYNLRNEFDESFDEFFDDEDLRKKYDDWDEEEQQPKFNESSTTLLAKLDGEDLEAYIKFYEHLIWIEEDRLSEYLEIQE